MIPEESAFQAILDANPEDHTARLVFADYLEELGDPRADGYRALGYRRVHPKLYNGGMFADKPEWTWWEANSVDFMTCYVEADWWKLIVAPKYAGRDKSFYSRVSAEDAAARAFAELPPDRRELLTQPVLS